MLEKDLTIDEELRDLLPPLAQDEYEKLEKSLLKWGLMDPIKVWENYRANKFYVIDGHNRLKICREHGISIGYWQIQIYTHNDFKNRNEVIKWMLENQLARRNIGVYERFEIVQKYKPMLEIKAKENMSAGGKGSTTLSKVNVREKMAKNVGTSEGTYAKLEKIYKSDNDDIKRKVKSGELSVNKAFEEIRSKDEVPATENVKPSIDIDQDVNKLKSDLELMIKSLTNTDDCDVLLEKIESYNSKINNIKNEVYLARSRKYNEMTDVDLTCEVIEENSGEMFGHKVKFYLVKRDRADTNRKIALEIYFRQLIDTDQKNLDFWMEQSERKLSKEEYKTLCMFVFKKREEFIQRNEEQKTKDARFWEDVTKQILNEKQRLTDCPATKMMMSDIIKLGYRQLAKQYHPDVAQDDGVKMQKLNNAKELMEKVVA